MAHSNTVLYIQEHFEDLLGKNKVRFLDAVNNELNSPYINGYDCLVVYFSSTYTRSFFCTENISWLINKVRVVKPLRLIKDPKDPIPG